MQLLTTRTYNTPGWHIKQGWRLLDLGVHSSLIWNIYLVPRWCTWPLSLNSGKDCLEKLSIQVKVWKPTPIPHPLRYVTCSWINLKTEYILKGAKRLRSLSWTLKGFQYQWIWTFNRVFLMDGDHLSFWVSKQDLGSLTPRNPFFWGGVQVCY